MHKNLLTRTPAPYPNESFGGYCLRLSESNGFASLSDMISLNEKSNLRKYQLPSSQTIGEITGHWKDPVINKYYTFSDSVSVVGNQLMPKHLTRNSSHFCPTCVSETGYIEAICQLEEYTVCHKHQTHLLHYCIACEREISETRRTMLTCRCGTDLTTMTQSAATDCEVELATAIHAAYQKTSLHDSQSKLGMPFGDLSRMPIIELLTLLNCMKNHLSNFDYGNDNTDIDKSLAHIFTDWPLNYRFYLKFVYVSLTNRHVFINPILEINLNKYDDPVLSKNLAFIRNEYVNYIIKDWMTHLDEVRFRPNLIVNSSLQKIAISLYSAVTCAKPSVVKNMLQKGSAFLISISNHQNGFIIRDNMLIKPMSKFSGLTVDESAVSIGISCVVLKYIIESGNFIRNYRTPEICNLSKEDVDAFLAAFTQSKSKLATKTKSMILLTETSKTYIRRGKNLAIPLIEILKCKLPFYLGSGNLKNIYVNESDITKLINCLAKGNDIKSIPRYHNAAICIDKEMLIVLKERNLMLANPTNYRQMFN